MTAAGRRASAMIAGAQGGMALMVLAMMLVPVNDVLSKLLTGSLSPVEITFWRFAVQTVVLLAVVVALRKTLRVGNWRLMILGGLTSATVLVALISALAVMPVATAIAIFFVEPLILTTLSAWILREPTGWRRYAAVAVGLAGALIVIRPSWTSFGWATLLPLVAAFAYACNAIIIRKASARAPSIVIQFWFAVVAFVALGGWLAISGDFALISGNGLAADGPWLLLVAMGLFSAFTFFLIAEAFRRTPAGTLAPFQYLEIIGATVLGYLVFGDLPDLWTWVGTAIILGAGLYVFSRERRRTLPEIEIETR